MTKRLKTIFLALAGLFFVLGVFLSPVWLVDHFLPGAYTVHRELLVQGLWVLKGALLFDAFVCLCLTRVFHVFTPVGCPSLPVFTVQEKFFILCIILLATVVRLTGILQGFGYDEIFMLQSLMTKSIPAALARAESWRALYGILGNISCRIFGASELAARLPAVLFGIAAVPALYCLLRHWTGRVAAGLAAIFLLVSTFHVWYSQDASAYSMAFLFAIVAMWALRCAVQDSAGWPWLIWGIMVALTICSHWYIGGLLLAGQFVYLGLFLVTGRLPWQGFIRATIVIAVAGAATITFMALSIPRQIKLFSALFNDVSQRGPMLENLIMLGQWLLQSYASLVWQVPIALLCGVGAVVCLCRSRSVVLYLMSSTVIMLIHWSCAEHQIICLRYGILTLLPVCAFFGIGVSSVASFVSARMPAVHSKLWFAVCLALLTVPLAGASFESLGTYYGRERYPIRPAACFVNNSIAPGSPVMFGGFAYDKFSFYAPRMSHLGEYDQLRSALKAGREFWLVYWFPNYYWGMPEDVRREFDSRAELRFHYEGFRQSQSERDYESFCWKVRHAERSGAVQ